MKRKSGLAFLLIISALAAYVFAQNQPDRQREEKQRIMQRTILMDKQVITLLQASAQRDAFVDSLVRESGNVAFVQIPPASLAGPLTFRNATLRIKLMDGSVQEIPLYKVNEVTIEQRGNIR